MKIHHALGILLICQTLITQSAHAQEEDSFGVFPRAGVGLNWLNFKRLDDSELDAYFTTLNVGLTINHGQIYYDLAGDLFGVDSNQEGDEIDDVNRQDFNFTVGYLLNEEVSLFVGYTFGETKDDSRGDFHEDIGFFAGAGYSFTREDTVYSATLAYADLNGEILVDEDADASTEGETTGFSLSFSMSGPFRETLGYTIALKTRLYTYNVDNSSLDSDKRITALNLSLLF